MNELPTEERCRKIMLSRIMPGEIQYFSDSERPAIKRWAEENGHDLLKMNDGETAARILSEHHGAPDTLPGRDEATGTEPKLALTAEERWHSQMNRSEVMITKQERLQHEEERLQTQREQQQDKFERILAQAEKLLIVAQGPELKITKTQTDAKTYTDPKPKPDAWATTEPKGWPTQASKDEEIAELRLVIKDQKDIIAILDKRLEAGRKRGQMVRDLLSKEL